VEKDDVEFEDEYAGEDADVNAADVEDDEHSGDEHENGHGAAARRSASAAPGAQESRQRIQITYDDYIKIHNLLLRRVNDDQASAEDGVEQEELLVWYLEQREDELTSQEDVQTQRALARKVLKRMVKVCLFPMIARTYANDDIPGQRTYADPWRGPCK
jgi:DNA replication licensing factor MCM6